MGGTDVFVLMRICVALEDVWECRSTFDFHIESTTSSERESIGWHGVIHGSDIQGLMLTWA